MVFWMEPLSVLSVIERFTPNIIYRVRTQRPLVALSFDDGPHPIFTLEVLEILHRHDAKATFFLIDDGSRDEIFLNQPRYVAHRRVHGVILHDGISDPTRSIQALPHILTAGRERGLRFVSIGALMREAAEHVEGT